MRISGLPHVVEPAVDLAQREHRSGSRHDTVTPGRLGRKKSLIGLMEQIGER
jgi:hypothetical protein